MSRFSIKSGLKPHYVIPVTGWIGCAFLLQFMVSGMQVTGMTRTTSVGDAQVLVLRSMPEHARAQVQVAASAEPAEQQRPEAASDAIGPEFAERRRPEAPL